MPDFACQPVSALLRRELQEYSSSLLWTPLLLALGILLVMLLSVLLANNVATMDNVVMEFFVEEGVFGSLNPLLHSLHTLMMLVLFLVTANYLLACLYIDRRDRSILFFKSMPVSDAREVLSKFAIAILVAPAVFIAASFAAQILTALLAMLALWRIDQAPFELVLANIDFLALLGGQIGGWFLTALWVAPVYAWLMLASAATRRSPFMTAIASPVALWFVERMFFGTAHVAGEIGRHLPHVSGGDLVDFAVGSSAWATGDAVSLLGGLAFAGAALWGAIHLRRTRFEI